MRYYLETCTADFRHPVGSPAGYGTLAEAEAAAVEYLGGASSIAVLPVRITLSVGQAWQGGQIDRDDYEAALAVLPAMLTAGSVARLLAISYTWVHRRLAAEDLPSHHYPGGRERLVRTSDLVEYAQRHGLPLDLSTHRPRKGPRTRRAARA